ncbi:hypothetical protein V5T82_17080 [Magnetovibrio sp. PR-2]|uniref:hypothetical protein n=1 Tax=Magnetovibrio sp. PR-2 TaxID=3120356 RepID=UPI002FCE13E9
MFRQAYGQKAAVGVAFCALMGFGLSAEGAEFDLNDPAWSVNKSQTALVHKNSGMHFSKTLGAFVLDKNIVHDNQGKSVSVVYLAKVKDKQVKATISVQTEETRSIDQLFKVSAMALGLRFGNIKPYKQANIKLSTKRGKLKGKAAAYNVVQKDQSVQNDTRLYMFKMGRNLIKVQTSHPMGFVRGGALIHTDLLKELNWASLKR